MTDCENFRSKYWYSIVSFLGTEEELYYLLDRRAPRPIDRWGKLLSSYAITDIFLCTSHKEE